MTRTYHILFNSVEIKQITNYNIEIVFASEPINGFIYREELSSDIICEGGDCAWLKEQYNGINKYKLHEFLIKEDGVIIWVGEFIMIGIKFDTQGTATFRPILKDKYTDILKNYDKKVNALSGISNFYTINYNVIGTLELAFEDYETDRSDDFWLVSSTGLKIYGVSGDAYVDYGASLWRLWARETCKVDDLGGSYAPLSEGISYRSYRHSYDANISLGSVIVVTINEDGTFQVSDTSAIPFSIYSIKLGQGQFTNPVGGLTSFYAFYGTTNTRNSKESTEYFTNDRGIKMYDLIQNIINKTIPDNPLILKSDFLFNDNNYVSNSLNNFVNNYFIDNKDFKKARNSSINENYISLKELMESLNLMLKDNLIWYIDDNGFFRIEHIEIFENENGLDLNDISEKTYTSFTDTEIDETKLYNREVLKMGDSGSTDWKDVNLIYDTPILPGEEEKVKEYQSNKITTDINYLITADSYDENSFLLLKTELSGSDIVVKKSTGASSLANVQNEKLSQLRLYFDFNRYNLPISQHIVESGDYLINNTAQKITRLKLQKISFISKNRIIKTASIKSNLGWGKITKLSLDRNIMEYNVTLAHR